MQPKRRSILTTEPCTGEPEVIRLFRNWVGGRPGISPLYEEIAFGLVRDPEMHQLLDAAMPVPLLCNRFMAAVHYLLLSGATTPLAKFYETVTAPALSPEGCYPHFREFCLSNASALLDLTRNCEVQINEVRRSAAFLYALNHILPTRAGSPLALIEVGACAGFNLNLDRYRYDFGLGPIRDGRANLQIACELRGAEARSPIAVPKLNWREGIDVAPIDVRKRSERHWLTAFASPDDHERHPTFSRQLVSHFSSQ